MSKMTNKILKVGNVPNLRFPGFEGEWENEKVGGLCDSIVPGRNKPTIFGGNLPWITTPDIKHNGTILFSKKGLNISEEEAKKIGSRVVPPNSVIISCVGDLGLAAIAGKEIIINQQLHAFIPKERIEYRFLLYQLNRQKKYMDSVATKTAVPYMNKDTCNSIPIFFTNLIEQKQIADFFSLIESRIETQNKIIEQLKTSIKGLCQEIFDRQKYQFSILPLKSLCSIKKGRQINASELTESGLFYVMNGGILPSGYHSEYNSDGNTISISEGGNSCGYVQYNKNEFWSGGHCYTLNNIGNIVTNRYLYYYLKATENKIMALRVGSGLPNIQKSALQKFEIKFPKVSEQEEIVLALDGLSNKQSIERKLLKLYQLQKKYLLQNLFV